MVLRLVDDFDSYEEADLVKMFRAPETDPVETLSGEPPGPHAPEYLVEPLDLCSPTAVSVFTGEVAIIDFDQSFASSSGPPQGSRPDTPAKYLAPEACVGRPLSRASDVWALGCAIFRIRSGDDLFPDYDNDCPANALFEIFRALGGKIPEDWAQTRFNEDGYVVEEDEPGWAFGGTILKPRPLEGRVRDIFDEPAGLFLSAGGVVVPPPLDGSHLEGESWFGPRDLALREAFPAPLRSKLWRATAVCFGGKYFFAYSDETTEMLKAFPKISEREGDLLLDLLRKIFVYDADERLTIEEVVAHPWFSFSD